METIEVQFRNKEVTTNDSRAFSIYKKSWFGEKIGEKIKYSLTEALYLQDKNKNPCFLKSL